MQYGLTLPNGGACADAKTLGEFAHLAEEAGWDGVFIEDSIIHFSAPDSPTFDPWIGLAVMALATNRVRLGTMVTPLARRRPWKVARETATLDHLSNGRLILGVGLGGEEDVGIVKFHEPALDNKEKAERLDEALEVLAGLWSGQLFSHRGKYYEVDPITFLPAPVQEPRIPIWVGGGYPRSGPLKRAARWDGACFYPVSDDNWTPAGIRNLSAYIKTHRFQETPFDIVISGQEHTADPEWDRALVSSYAEAGATWWVEYVHAADKQEMSGHIKQGPPRIE